MEHVSRILSQTKIKRDRQVTALAISEATILELEKLVLIDSGQIEAFDQNAAKKKP